MAYGGNFLKCILTYLCCTKYNEIIMCHLDVQNHVSQGNTKISDIIWSVLGKGWKCVFNYVSLRCVKACFIYNVTQKFSDILWAMLRNGRKLCSMVFNTFQQN